MSWSVGAKGQIFGSPRARKKTNEAVACSNEVSSNQKNQVAIEESGHLAISERRHQDRF